jgi:hypothetical protein
METGDRFELIRSHANLATVHDWLHNTTEAARHRQAADALA